MPAPETIDRPDTLDVLPALIATVLRVRVAEASARDRATLGARLQAAAPAPARRAVRQWPLPYPKRAA